MTDVERRRRPRSACRDLLKRFDSYSITNSHAIEPRIGAAAEGTKRRIDCDRLSTSHETVQKVMGLHPICRRFLACNYLMSQRSQAGDDLRWKCRFD
jgi:hypothetical protein